MIAERAMGPLNPMSVFSHHRCLRKRTNVQETRSDPCLLLLLPLTVERNIS